MMELYLTLKRIFIWRKDFLKYSAWKKTLLNILENFAIYSFKYFVLHINDNSSK